MRKFVLRWIILAVSLVISSILTGFIVQGFKIEITGFADAFKLLIGVAVLALLNATLGKILKFITVPLNCLTLGLLSLAINAIVLMVAGSLGFGFKVDNFFAAIVGSVLISIVNALLGGILIRDDEDKE
jgi:putative membrane protein